MYIRSTQIADVVVFVCCFGQWSMLAENQLILSGKGSALHEKLARLDPDFWLTHHHHPKLIERRANIRGVYNFNQSKK